MELVTPIRWHVTYTGANSAEVLDAVQKVTPYSGNVWSIVKEDADGLVLLETSPVPHQPAAQWLIVPNTYVVIQPDFGIVARISPAAGAARFNSYVDIYSAAASDPAVINKLGAALQPQYENGVTSLPVLLLGSSASLIVPLSGTFPDTNYQVKTRMVSGTAVLSMLSVTNIVKATNSVTVTVRASGVASVAGNLFVDCHRYYAASSIK